MGRPEARSGTGVPPVCGCDFWSNLTGGTPVPLKAPPPAFAPILAGNRKKSFGLAQQRSPAKKLSASDSRRRNSDGRRRFFWARHRHLRWPRRRWKTFYSTSRSRNAGIWHSSSRSNARGFRCRAHTVHNGIRRLAWQKAILALIHNLPGT